ncbi:MAG: FAD-binding protein [Geminicoccaceae bacterium]
MSDRQHSRPVNIDELREAVAWAVGEERTLEVRGNGTKADYGRPVECSAVLETTGLAGIDMYEPDELVMSAGAGTPLADIEAALAEKGQMLAFEPADFGAILGGEAGRQTIGGVFAANLCGPRRIRSGAARDHLLGLQTVTGHGQIIKTGGRVVKNVTGYDLCKLLTGSMGTLAVMSHVTFKVLPAPETCGTLLLTGAARAMLLGALCRAMGSAFDVSSAALLPAAAAARSTVPDVSSAGGEVAALRIEGPAPSVAYRISRLEDLLHDGEIECARLDPDGSALLWREIRDVTLLDRRAPLWRISTAPTAAADIAGEREDVLFDWSGGLIWATGDERGDLRARVDAAGGHATLVRASPELRSAMAPFHPQAGPLRALSQRVKNSFDPGRVLNSGRMYEGI